MPRSTRLQTGFAAAKEVISDIEAEAASRLAAVDEKLCNDWECYYCMGSEGPMRASNCEVVVCGHGYHVGCSIKARTCAFRQSENALDFQFDLQDGTTAQVIFGLRCGMCRYKFVGNDIVDMGSIFRKVNAKCQVPSEVKGIPAAIRGRDKQLKDGLERLEVVEKIMSREYTRDNLPPPNPNPDCAIM
jgi:hypothetical protein